MAFDNVTFFEVNLPDDAFGGTGKSDHETKSTESDSTDGRADDESGSGGPSVGRLLLVATVIAGVAVAVRRFRSGDDEEIEMEYEEPGVEVEQTEA